MASFGVEHGMNWLSWAHQRASSKPVLYDTHKVYSMLVDAGLDTDKAEFFVSSYADLLKSGKTAVNGSSDKLRQHFVEHGYSSTQAVDAVSLLTDMMPGND